MASEKEKVLRVLPCRGPNKQSYCKMHSNQLIQPDIVLFKLKNVRLQFIFNLEIDDMEKSFKDLQKSVDANTFRYECMLAFWLAIHLQLKEAAVAILQLDEIIKKVVENLRKFGETTLNNKREKDEIKRKK